MIKTEKRNLFLTGLIVFVFGLFTFLGVKAPVQTVHAIMEDIAGSELQFKTLKLNNSQSDCTVTFADGRYLHLNPDTNVTVVNNISDGADMEYYNGVLKFYINDNDDFNKYKYYNMSVYALNSTDKQLTVAVDYNIYFNTFDYPKGDLTVTTLDSVNHSVCFSDEFYTTGTVTVNGYAKLDVNPNGLNSNHTSTFEAGALRVLDNASFYSHTYSDDDSYAVKVTNLTLNTNGDFSVYAYNNGHISALKVDAGTITLTKCHLLKIYSKTQSSDRTKVTNVTSLRNAPENPIDGFYATYVDDYDDGLHLDVVPEQALHTVSFNSNGGSGTMADVENVYYSYKTPACTFTAPEGKKFSCWIIGAPDGPIVNSGSTTEITQDITLYACWKKTVPSDNELRLGNSFGNCPSSSSYDDVNGVLTLSSSTNCDITVNSTSGRSDLTIVFDGNYQYGYSNNESNYFGIRNDYGDITLTSETPVTVYACIKTLYSLTIKGNVHLVPTGLPTTYSGLYWGYLKENGYFQGLIHAANKLSVLENASISAIDRYLYNSSEYVPVISAKYFEFDTTGEVEIGTKTQVYGSRKNAAICFYDTTGITFSAHSEIIGRMTIKRCGQDGCLKLYRYNDYDYDFIGVRPQNSEDLGKPYVEYLHFNRNISAYTTGGVDAELLTLKPCIVTFNNGGGSGTMATDYTTVKEDYTLPACTFTAPAGKHFAGWSINGADPVNANTTYAVPDQTASLTLTAVWEDDPANALTGTVAINGNLKFGETLTAVLSGDNNTGILSYEWRRNGETISGATAQTYTLTQDDIGYTMSVVVRSSEQSGSLVGTAASTIDKADGPNAPTGITATACTTNANNNGTLVGITAEMEYKLSSSEDWTNGTGATITNLANGTYNVRYKETATHKAGASANVVVNAYNAPVQYGITVVDGGANVLSAEAGTAITITADEAPSGYVFDKWTSTDGVVFADENSTTTTFTMPAKAVTITATYKLAEVEPQPQPEKPEENKGGLGAGAIIGIVLAALVVGSIGGFAIYWFVIKKKTWADFVKLFKRK